MISIIIPVYNAEKSISKCIESILNNNFDDFEIIAINDGSKDQSFKILKEYEEKYPEKIRIFNQENQGVAKTRNFGISHAKGEFLMFIDNDDFIDEDYLGNFLNEIKEDNLDVVIGGYRRVTNEKILFEIKLMKTEWSKYLVMAPWAKIYRKDFLLKNKIEFLDNNIGEDVYFNLQVVNLTEKISIIDYCGYNWFYNEKSVSNSKQKNVKHKMNVLFLLNSSFDKLSEIGVIEKEEVEFYFTRYVVWYLLFAGRNSNFKEIIAETEMLFDWLFAKFPNFLKNKSMSLFRPVGESFKNRFSVFVFFLFYKLKVLKFFLKAYSK